MDWWKFGRGEADEAVHLEVLQRVGLPAAQAEYAEDWAMGDRVRMLDYEPKNKPFLIGEPSLPSEAQVILDMSPRAALEARRLLIAFYPCHDPRYVGQDTIGGCYGCKTDDVADFGHIYSSKTCLVGLVEGLVSSLANWKLYACGLSHHHWTDELLTVAPDARFVHLLRQEEAAAGTVVHTLYCCAHMLSWYRHVLARAPQTKGAAYRAGVLEERVGRGLAVLPQIMEHTTPDGLVMLEAMHAWGTSLLAGEDDS